MTSYSIAVVHLFHSAHSHLHCNPCLREDDLEHTPCIFFWGHIKACVYSTTPAKASAPEISCRKFACSAKADPDSGLASKCKFSSLGHWCASKYDAEEYLEHSGCRQTISSHGIHEEWGLTMGCNPLPAFFRLKIFIIFPSLSKPTLLFSFFLFILNSGHVKDQQCTMCTEHSLHNPRITHSLHIFLPPYVTVSWVTGHHSNK